MLDNWRSPQTLEAFVPVGALAGFASKIQERLPLRSQLRSAD